MGRMDRAKLARHYPPIQPISPILPIYPRLTFSA
jgi:hypothetical protein